MNTLILLNNTNYYKFQPSLNEINNNYNTNEYSTKFVILTLLIIILLFNVNELTIMTGERVDSNYVMGNYSLYNLSKYPQISLLIYNVENWKLNEKQLLKFLQNILNQNLNNIQIIFILKKKTDQNIKDFIYKNSLEDKRIEIFECEKYIDDNIYQLIEKIQGKFTILIDKLISFGINQLEKYYNSTKGKINNIYEFSYKDSVLYLIKTKILSVLLDEENLNFNNTELINNIKSIPLPNLNYISIAFCPNNKYTPFTYVSMISILSTKSFYTYISFYLITDETYKNSNKNFLDSLYEQFDFFNITFLTMDDRYKKAYISRRMTPQTYYRFSLGELLPFLNKIIYLDSDVIVYKDLSNLYNLGFNGKFVLGQVTGNNRYKRTGVYRINNGILLFNLYNMRKYQIETKALNIINKGKHLFYHDQTLMNNYFKKYIGIFQLEYHIRNWKNFTQIMKFNRNSGNIYDNDYFYFTSKYPSIRHFLGKTKPIYSEKGHIEDWWFFARKSKFYSTKSKDLNKVFNFKFE